ncbi:MAG: hypothetical protein K2L52_04610 [Clostridia bacterium]|nr:hypothetical protein [Clostridia bacterium]
MITLISALNLTAKIGISIAVFVVLIAVEVLALVMLVKWKKNYKQALIKKAKEDKRDAELANSKPVTAIDLSQEHAEVNTVENTAVEASEDKQDEKAEDKAVANETENQVVSKEQDKVVEEETSTNEKESEEVVSEEKQDSVADATKAFAFAPLFMWGATTTAMTLRGFLYVLIGIAVALAVAVFATAVIFSQNLKHGLDELEEDVPAKDPTIVKKPEEEPMKETEEPVAEEKVSQEPVVEEKPVEEEIAEEELTAEAVEEVQEEQPAEEEAVAEEEPIVAEAEPAVAEEEPVVEEQPVVEEKPKPAPVKREPKPRERAVVIDNVSYMMKDDRFLFNPTDDGWYILLTKTFTAKLIQSDEYVKDYYTELKNELLSYNKVHARMSKKRESFNFGRTCLARLSIRGKTLRLHLALDANDYAETKYIVEDTSQTKSLADTPLMYRIKNDRRLKYAKELIATLMEKVGAVKQEIEPVNYTAMYPYEETEPLIERDLITRRFVKGKVPEDKGFDFAQKTFKAKLIQSDDAVKEYYSKVKNHLLSYKKIHDRLSKKRETYRFGRVCVARMAIRGKTLRLYLALNPADYVDTKYIVEDFSHVKSVADTPLAIKLKNPRRLKYAMELIDATMVNMGVVHKRDIIDTDYTSDLAYESTEELMEKGLVTNVHVKGNSFVAQHFSFKEKDAEDEVASDEDK